MRRPQKDIQLTTYDDLLGISEIDDTDGTSSGIAGTGRQRKD